MVKVVFGMMGSSVGHTNILADASKSAELLSILRKHNVAEIDTARVYNGGASGERLGSLEAHMQFKVQTKAPAFFPGSLTYANIVKNCQALLKSLCQDRVDTYYLHGPDPQTSIEEQCSAINELYTQVKFARFGISNLTSNQIQEVYDICKKNFVLPSVYQGGYNPVLRTSEKHRLPLCRKLRMAFYAYSPLAGGFLAKPLEQILHPAKGTRFEAMAVFGQIYCNAGFTAGVKRLDEKHRRHNIRTRAASLRWLLHHSALGDGDGLILGASTLAQAEANLQDCQGQPLPDDIVQAFEIL